MVPSIQTSAQTAPKNMAAILPVQTKQVLAISGEALIVYLRDIPGTENEVVYHITRNGSSESRFSVTELQDILQKSAQLLAQARTRVRVATPATK